MRPICPAQGLHSTPATPWPTKAKPVAIAKVNESPTVKGEMHSIVIDLTGAIAEPLMHRTPRPCSVTERCIDV